MPKLAHPYVIALKSYFDPMIFIRVCMVTWAVPFLLIGAIGILQLDLHPHDLGDGAALALVSLLAVFGVFLAGVGTFGSDARVERSVEFMSEGGDILGVVLALAVVAIAVPVTLLIGWVLRWKDD